MLAADMECNKPKRAKSSFRMKVKTRHKVGKIEAAAEKRFYKQLEQDVMKAKEKKDPFGFDADTNVFNER